MQKLLFGACANSEGTVLIFLRSLVRAFVDCLNIYRPNIKLTRKMDRKGLALFTDLQADLNRPCAHRYNPKIPYSQDAAQNFSERQFEMPMNKMRRRDTGKILLLIPRTVRSRTSLRSQTLWSVLYKALDKRWYLFVSFFFFFFFFFFLSFFFFFFFFCCCCLFFVVFFSSTKKNT